jgi:hypothetical protein
MYLCSDGSCMNAVEAPGLCASCRKCPEPLTTPEPSERPKSSFGMAPRDFGFGKRRVAPATEEKRETYAEWLARGGKVEQGTPMTCHRPSYYRLYELTDDAGMNSDEGPEREPNGRRKRTKSLHL